MDKIVIVYKTKDDEEPFLKWLFALRDKITKHRIEIRVERMRQGNYGNHKRFHGILEIRLDFGKGYRLYCGEDGNSVVLLLLGGDKSSQDRDIKKALEYWEDYNEQKKI